MYCWRLVNSLYYVNETDWFRQGWELTEPISAKFVKGINALWKLDALYIFTHWTEGRSYYWQSIHDLCCKKFSFVIVFHNLRSSLSETQLSRTYHALGRTTGPPARLAYMCRADSTLAHSQWETALLCKDVSHWLGANLESTLHDVYRYGILPRGCLVNQWLYFSSDWLRLAILQTVYVTMIQNLQTIVLLLHKK